MIFTLLLCKNFIIGLPTYSSKILYGWPTINIFNELALRKIKKIPKLNIIIDELESEVGLKTRLESFIDILSNSKKVNYENN